MSAICVIDFETNGLMPGSGGRATEVAIVRLEQGEITARFQSLMNAGVRIPHFITRLTGITNAMVAQAPPAHEVMAAAQAFVGDTPMVAHNASFDRKFWQDELGRLDLPATQPFACTVLLSRRLYPQAPNHKLGTLVDFHGLSRTGTAHRALADAEMATALLLRIQQDLRGQWGLSCVDHPVLMTVQGCAMAALPQRLSAWAATQDP
jgi:DNA polymerase-3 subunit epsilon